MLTKGAIGNLVNRYRAVLKKCNLINTFGSLAVASMIVMGGAGVAGATPVDGGIIYTNAATSENYKNTDFIKKDLNSFSDKTLTITCSSGGTTAIWVGGGDEKFNLDITDSSNQGIVNITGAVFPQSGTHSIKAKKIDINGNTGSAIVMAGGSLNLIADSVKIYNTGTSSNAIQEGGAYTSKLTIDATAVEINSERTALRATRGMEITINADNLTISTTNDKKSAIESDDANDAITLNVKKATLNGNILSAGTFTGNGQFNLNGKNNSFNELNTTKGGSIEFVLSKADTTVEIAQNKAKNLGFTGSKELTDAYGGDITKLAEQVNIEKGAEGTTLKLRESDIIGETTAKLNKDSKVDTSTIETKRNTLMDAALQQASITTVALDKILTNDVRKRLGDIRSDMNQTGVWMRWDGGKLKGDGLNNNFNTIQIGGDTKVGKNCRLGVAGSFTHGDAEFARGTAELEGFSFAGYATWMGENGMFADVVARIGHFSNEMKVEGRKGDMDNRVASLSGEYGWRFSVCDQFFVEPQVELAYTYVSSDDLELGTAHYEFDNVDSLTGRVGLVAGWNLPNDMGNLYARASVVQQFMGDAKISGVNGSARNIQEIDGKDTWMEYGIGANIKLTDKTYIWADVERTAGAKIDEEWRGTVGVRFSF